jgi:regulator of CtrA degradation
MSDDGSSQARVSREPVAFGQRLAGSDLFKGMFREGMALVEETATYLDGDGRRESHRLSRAASLAYATESMRLTTRLMQLASWLLLQRAVNDGDLTPDQASQERAKV